MEQESFLVRNNQLEKIKNTTIQENITKKKCVECNKNILSNTKNNETITITSKKPIKKIENIYYFE